VAEYVSSEREATFDSHMYPEYRTTEARPCRPARIKHSASSIVDNLAREVNATDFATDLFAEPAEFRQKRSLSESCTIRGLERKLTTRPKPPALMSLTGMLFVLLGRDKKANKQTLKIEDN
jgi:hypothetical protein